MKFDIFVIFRADLHKVVSSKANFDNVISWWTSWLKSIALLKILFKHQFSLKVNYWNKLEDFVFLYNDFFEVCKYIVFQVWLCYQFLLDFFLKGKTIFLSQWLQGQSHIKKQKLKQENLSMET